VPADIDPRHIRGQGADRAGSEGLPVVGFHRETERTSLGDASPQDRPPVVDRDVDAQVLEDEDQPDRVVAPEPREAFVRLADCQHLALDGDNLPGPRLSGPGLSRAVRPLDPVRVVPGEVGDATEPGSGRAPGDQTTPGRSSWTWRCSRG